jgi:hypothetical protein
MICSSEYRPCFIAKLSEPVVLGHIIAHELGHLLLGFAAHPRGVGRGGG